MRWPAPRRPACLDRRTPRRRRCARTSRARRRGAPAQGPTRLRAASGGRSCDELDVRLAHGELAAPLRDVGVLLHDLLLEVPREDEDHVRTRLVDRPYRLYRDVLAVHIVDLLMRTLVVSVV